MKIGSTLENQKFEKRIAITPEIAKKYISLGFDVQLSKNIESITFSLSMYLVFRTDRRGREALSEQQPAKNVTAIRTQ